MLADNFFVLTLISRYLEQILKQRHILGAFYLTCFQYMYFNILLLGALMKKFKGMLYPHWSMGTQYPIEFFLKDTIHLCICSFTDLSLLLFAKVYSVTVFIMAFSNCNSLDCWGVHSKILFCLIINASWLAWFTLFQPLWHFLSCYCSTQYTINYHL